MLTKINKNIVIRFDDILRPIVGSTILTKTWMLRIRWNRIFTCFVYNEWSNSIQLVTECTRTSD